MTLTVAGWAECRNLPEQFASYGDTAWVPVVNIEPILSDEDEIREGVPFRNRLGEGGGQLAAGWGLPDDVSSLVARAAARYNVPWDSTYLTGLELRQLHSRESLKKDCQLVLAIVEPLAAVCGDENVRLVLRGYITDYGMQPW